MLSFLDVTSLLATIFPTTHDDDDWQDTKLDSVSF